MPTSLLHVFLCKPHQSSCIQQNKLMQCSACTVFSASPCCPAGAAALSIQDLPTHPEIDCAGDAVTAAFAKCLLRGATAACCNGLDSVYANSSRPSFG
jgi:hypothetical protein